MSDAHEALKEWDDCSGYIVQECIKQHKVLANINESSVNMMRVYSWRHENNVDVLFVTVRAGIDGAVTDGSFVGGEEHLNFDIIGWDFKIDENGGESNP